MSVTTTLTPFERRVLGACQSLIARGAHPSCGAIEAELGIQRRGGIHKARQRLLEAGLVAFEVASRGRPKGFSPADVQPCAHCGDPGGMVDRGRIAPRRRLTDWSEGGVRQTGKVCGRCACQISRERSRSTAAVDRRPGGLNEQVFRACRTLVDGQVYPSVVRIQRELSASYSFAAIFEARRLAQESGEFPEVNWNVHALRRLPRSPAFRAPGVLAPELPPEEVAANALAERGAALARTRDAAPAIPALSGRTLLDVLSSPRLDDLPPAKVAKIIVRRVRKAAKRAKVKSVEISSYDPTSRVAVAS